MKSKTIKTLRIAAFIIGTVIATVGAIYFAFYTADKQAGEKAGFLALFAMLVTLFVDQAILLLAKDTEDVLTELAEFQHRLGIDVVGSEAITALERLRKKPLHHYHMTKNKVGDTMWSYKVLNFGSPPSAGKLTALASFMPSAGGNEEDHEYQIEASVDRSHLVLRTRRVGRDPDVGIDFSPTLLIAAATVSFRFFTAVQND